MYRIDGHEVARDLERVLSAVEAAARQALGQAAAYAHELARRTAKFKDKTGKLRTSIVRGARGPWSLFVKAGGQGVRYAGFVEDGTQAHIITAKRARALRFVQAGTVRFAKSVHHPGTKPTYFMRNARDQAEMQLARFTEAGVSSAVH